MTPSLGIPASQLGDIKDPIVPAPGSWEVLLQSCTLPPLWGEGNVPHSWEVGLAGGGALLEELDHWEPAWRFLALLKCFN